MSTIVFLETTLKDDADGVDGIVRETLAQTIEFDGCEALRVVRDDADPTSLVVIETWETTAAHDAYVAWRATPEGANRLGQILAKPPVTRVFSTGIEL